MKTIQTIGPFVPELRYLNPQTGSTGAEWSEWYHPDWVVKCAYVFSLHLPKEMPPAVLMPWVMETIGLQFMY